MRGPALCAGMLCLTLSACTGLFEAPLGSDTSGAGKGSGPDGTGKGSGDGDVIGSNGQPLDCNVQSAGEAPLSRLTRSQYARTVSDLLGVDASSVAETFPSDESTNGFAVGLSVSPLLTEAYAKAAEELAAKAVSQLDLLLPCDPVADGEAACAQSFIKQLGRRAFRRALTAEELAGLTAVFNAGRTDAEVKDGVALVVEALLSSPSFLYHVDTVSDAAQGVHRLSADSLASRLSYLVWGSMPDDLLLDAAEAGELDSDEGLVTQAERMLKARPEAAKQGFREFYRQWLNLAGLDGLERDKTLFPDYAPDQAQALRASIEAQIDHSVWEDGGDLAVLLLSERAFVNERVAPLFGLSSDAQELGAADLPENQRRGILTHPALLAVLSKPNQSDPVIRGKFVRERLLCQQLPPPPANLAIVAPDPAPGLTTRERFAEHSNNPSCVGCHRLMDPIGFGLEHYDALGQYREQEESLTIDARGEVLDGKDASGKFDGALELSEMLAASDEVAACVATQFFRYALSRTETDDDLCSLARVEDSFIAQNKDLRSLILEVIKSDSFRLRSIAKGETP